MVGLPPSLRVVIGRVGQAVRYPMLNVLGSVKMELCGCSVFGMQVRVGLSVWADEDVDAQLTELVFTL